MFLALYWSIYLFPITGTPILDGTGYAIWKQWAAITPITLLAVQVPVTP